MAYSRPPGKNSIVYPLPKDSLTNFVGRVHEIEELTELIEKVRLLTLTGAGGSGKSRLALHVVHEVEAQFPDGVCWVELESLTDASLVTQTVAQALGIHSAVEQSLDEAIGKALESKRLLLLLDNCEHVRMASSQLIEVLLNRAPSLKIVSTSREALGLPGETTWLVPSLSMPPLAEHETLSISDLMRYDAFVLFADRIQAAQPKFVFGPQNLAAAVRICQQLDGIPLAIELAATKVKMLTLHQISARLDDRLILLTANYRGSVIPRHQTLRATIDWSYDLLSSKEKVLFERLAVFIGGFSLDAAEGVCAGPSIEKGEILLLLSNLIDKSMVVAETEGRTEARYRLLETIRQYAMLKLYNSSETEKVQDAHLDFYRKLALEAEKNLKDRLQTVTWLGRLDLEHDNLRTALGWSLAGDSVQKGLQLAGTLGRFWDTRGYLSEGRSWLERLLPKSDMNPSVILANALNVAGNLAMSSGDLSSAHSHLQSSLAIQRELGDQRGISLTLNNLAVVTINQGDYATAHKLLEESATIKRTLTDSVGLAHVLNNLGEVERYEGNDEQAIPLYTESLAIRQALDDKEQASTALYNLGSTYLALGKFKQAAQFLEESLTVAQTLGYRRNIILCIAQAAILASKTGQSALAVKLSGAADTHLEKIGLQLEPIDRLEYDRTIALLRNETDSYAFSELWATGCALNTDRAVEQSLEVLVTIRSEPDDELPISESRSQSKLQIYALGNVRVLLDGQQVKQSDWTYTKSRELFFYFLSHKKVSKRQIGLDLWPDESTQQLRNNYRAALHCLRRALGSPKWIVFEDEVYAFDSTLDYWFDVENFESLLMRAKSAEIDRPEAIELLTKAVEQYTGDFLADIEVGDWSITLREELRRLYLDSGLTLVQMLFDDVLYSDAAEICRTLINTDNYLEAAHYALIRCYARLGERSKALQQYHSLVGILQDDLGLPPSPELTVLYDRLCQGEPI
jgi:predicted ATPase/DNA-binding SARP family transcriptional activator